jgi:hypothetical protein
MIWPHSTDHERRERAAVERHEPKVGYHLGASFARLGGHHDVAQHGGWQLISYPSERGHSGPMNFSFSRMLYRKKPEKRV